jgi:predicted amidohydrolase YtcJ
MYQTQPGSAGGDPEAAAGEDESGRLGGVRTTGQERPGIPVKTANTMDSPNTLRLVLYHGGRVYSQAGEATSAVAAARAGPAAAAMLTDGGTVAWVGSDAAAQAFTAAADAVVDLGGALVTPAFVDAHVHTTAAGLALTGLDLSGTPTLVAALDALAAYAGRHPGATVIGGGWDETAWPDARPPRAAELDRAAGGAPVYLARVDGHTAVVSSVLAARAGAADLPGWAGEGLCTGAAHHATRVAADAALTAGQRSDAQRALRAHAARLGVAALHEMAGSEVSSLDDLTGLLALAAAEPGPEIVGYWAGDVATAAELGVCFGGDAFIDGSLGSRTAALREPYADAPGCHGTVHLDVDAVAEVVGRCVQAGLQAGFHAIGDAAVETVLAGFERAADVVGFEQIVAGRHRVEHAVLADAGQLARMARLRLVAGVQPAFDARWGGADGMYVQRLGASRAQAANPFAAMASAGVTLALSSDAPVTPVDPWGAVRAAARHRTPGSALSVEAAFAAATRGGWVAARADADGSGRLVPGAPATFAVWQAPGEPLADLAEAAELADSRSADSRSSATDGPTDPRVPPLPGLLPDLDAPVPECLRTVVRGAVIHDALA